MGSPALSEVAQDRRVRKAQVDLLEFFPLSKIALACVKSGVARLTRAAISKMSTEI